VSLPKSKYFERVLATEIRFYECWIERDIQPPPYLSGWSLRTIQGGASYGDKYGILGSRALTGARLAPTQPFNTRAEANAALKQARALALRAGYAEVSNPRRRLFSGYPHEGARRKFALKKALAKP
jgi:hypothetical protein